MQKSQVWRSDYLIVAVGLLAWLMLTAYFRPLLLPDEGRYADVAREMLQGDWKVPTLDGMPFFHKPPLMYWIDILAMKTLGMNEFSARMGSLLGAWLCGIVVFVMLRRWQGMQVARAAVIVLATSPFFYFSGQYANHDMLVAGLISVAILLFARGVEDPDTPSRRFIWMAYAVCALAMLSKGLIGVVIPGMVIVPWLVFMKRWKSLGHLVDGIGIGLFLLICLPWFIAMQLRYPDFFHYFFVYQHVDRFLQHTFNNVQPAWFYLAVLPALTLPWAVFAPAALRRAWRERSPIELLCLWWLVITLLFFSIMRSKLVGYILPVVAPWSILIAIWFAQRKYFKWLTVTAASLCLATVVLASLRAPDSHRQVAAMLTQQMAPNDAVVFVGDFFYDIPFYAHLNKPIVMVEDWNAPDMEIVDNWRQELKHASNFDSGHGKDRLIDNRDVATLQCLNSTVWFVVQNGMSVPQASLFALHKLYAKQDVILYRSNAAERTCPISHPPITSRLVLKPKRHARG